MKHKKALLFLFLTILLVFQQVEVDAKALNNTEKLSPNKSAQVDGLPTTVLIYMKEFDVNGGPTNNLCYLGDTTLGCVEPGSGLTYPPSNQYVTFESGQVNPIRVDIENYYLQNVLPREMNVKEIYPTLEALKAQALAARTIADWKAGDNEWITNVTTDQVFVPGSYDYYNNLNERDAIKGLINQAITETSGQYLSFNGDGQSIDAEFGSDFVGQSTSEGTKDYLISIADPISTACDATTIYSGWGMSQKGAIRWSKGNQCAANGDQPWSVKWDSYKQILVHYYTGVDILDGNGNKIVPDNRWNLLSHEVPVANGTAYDVHVRLQNTSTTDWAANDIIIGYQWTAQNASFVPGRWKQLTYLSQSVAKGAAIELKLSIPVQGGGNVTLHLDLQHQSDEHWFSEQTLGWFDASIDIDNVVAPTATPANTPIPVITSTPVSTLTPTNTPTPANMLQLVSYTTNFTDPHVGGGGSHTITHWESIAVGESALEIFFSFYTYGTTDNSGNIARTAAVVGVKNVGSSTIAIKSKEYYRVTGVPSPGIVQLKLFDGWMNVQDGEYSHDGSVGASGNQTVWATIGLGDQWASPCHNCPYTLEASYHLTVDVSGDSSIVCPPKALSEDYASTLSSLKAPFYMASNIQQALFDLELLYRVRDEILSQTISGQHYIDLYYRHGVEITHILRNNLELKNEAIATLQYWEPKLRALVYGQGDSISISQEEVNAVEHFLSGLEAVGSNDLRIAIQTEKANLNMQVLVGQTMRQAWDKINGVATATPTANPSTTPTSTSTVTPTFAQTTTPTMIPTSAPTYTPTVTQTSTPMVPTFEDVPLSHVFWRYIEAIYRAGITTGCSQTPKLFCPDSLITRGEMAVLIERAMGNFSPNPSPSGMFADVPYPGMEAFTPFIEEFYNDGITIGCSQSPLKYCPQNNVTRGEIAVFIERAMGNFSPNPSPSGMFADVPYPGMEAFTPFIEEFYNDGITTGCTQNPLKYCPAKYVTRSDIAVFIVRAFNIPLP